MHVVHGKVSINRMPADAAATDIHVERRVLCGEFIRPNRCLNINRNGLLWRLGCITFEFYDQVSTRQFSG